METKKNKAGLGPLLTPTDVPLLIDHQLFQFLLAFGAATPKRL